MMKKPNFLELTRKHAELNDCRIDSTRGDHKEVVRFDWNDSKTQRTLTKIILKNEFNVDVELSPDRLCPPVPNRMSYLKWLSDLLAITGSQIRPPTLPQTNFATKVSEAEKSFPEDQENDSEDSVVIHAMQINPHETSEGIEAFWESIADCGMSSCDANDETPVTKSGVDTHVLDIGVGASCIYPLLGHKLYKWR